MNAPYIPAPTTSQTAQTARAAVAASLRRRASQLRRGRRRPDRLALAAGLERLANELETPALSPRQQGAR